MTISSFRNAPYTRNRHKEVRRVVQIPALNDYRPIFVKWSFHMRYPLEGNRVILASFEGYGNYT